MPIVANAEAAEIPWRPGYRTFTLAGKEQGLGCIASYSVVEPGAGAPLHVHANVDEIFIVLEGRLEFRLGEERHLVEANHTVAIPAGTPHGFTALGSTPARMFVFLPRHGEIASATTYLEGHPPKGAQQH
jgi:quercetin dioxygenase-like cupin family protein